jgi:DNA repair protein SbcD/Mre11
MRLVHLSDFHLGHRQFQRQTPAGINQREADVASAFRDAIDGIIALRPDIVCIAGDVFHNVRPSNPAILHAFTQFSRLVHALPDTIVVIVAGNHDTPRSVEAGCILRLFIPLGIHVADMEAKRFSFPERDLSIFAVPSDDARSVAYGPDPDFRWNVLVLHASVVGVVPGGGADPDLAARQIDPAALRSSQWSYQAIGHYHVYRELAPNAFYSGAIEYTSSNIWGEQAEEKALRLGGKGMVEFDLETGKRTFHRIRSARGLVDLPVVRARAQTAADIDAAVRANVDQVPGGIDEKIVRQVIQDIPRHVARELDHRLLREYRRHALHFQLEARRPEVHRTSASGAPGRRPSLVEIVRDKLRNRPIQSDVDREALVELGLRYLREADVAEKSALAVSTEPE